MSPLAERDVVWAYQTWFPLLRRKCQRMLADPGEAAEVAQETFTRLWSRRLDFEDVDRISAWLYTISTRLAIDRLRRRRPTEVLDHAVGGNLPESVVAARQALSGVAQALSREQLELLILWRIDGLEQKEIAEVVGMSERTVRRRLHEAQRRLATLEAADGP